MFWQVQTPVAAFTVQPKFGAEAQFAFGRVLVASWQKRYPVRTSRAICSIAKLTLLSEARSCATCRWVWSALTNPPVAIATKIENTVIATRISMMVKPLRGEFFMLWVPVIKMVLEVDRLLGDGTGLPLHDRIHRDLLAVLGNEYLPRKIGRDGAAAGSVAVKMRARII